MYDEKDYLYIDLDRMEFGGVTTVNRFKDQIQALREAGLEPSFFLNHAQKEEYNDGYSDEDDEPDYEDDD